MHNLKCLYIQSEIMIYFDHQLRKVISRYTQAKVPRLTQVYYISKDAFNVHKYRYKKIYTIYKIHDAPQVHKYVWSVIPLFINEFPIPEMQT